MEKHKPVVVVSGGNGYVGQEIIRRFAAAHFETVSLSRSKNTQASASYECDIADPDAVKAVAKKIADTFGLVQICIHAASAHGKESFEIQEKVALSGALALSQSFIPIIEKGGAFIGITTKFLSAGVEPPPLHAYIKAKRELKDFLKDLAQSSTPLGIRIYALAPGYLPGGLNREVPKETLEFLAAKSNAGMTSKEAVAELAFTLATQRESYPSGISVDIPGNTITSL